MGRTYEAKKGGTTFDVNYSGADILGITMKAVDCHSKELEANDARYGITDRYPSTLFETTEQEAKEQAAKIKALTPEQLKAIFTTCQELWGGTEQEFRDFLEDWATFLDTCKGYIVN
jgi:hypothetical protein